jgi:sigma54-dependent transcription regulator
LDTLLLGYLLLEYLFVETPKDSRRDADLLDFCQIQHLDEIGDLPLETQPKLLRFLDSKEIHPLREATPQRVAVRIVAATHADLERDASSRTET